MLLKRKLNLLVLLFCLIFCGCSQPLSSSKHVFYLHGRIIEVQGIHAVHKEFGPYLYEDIIDYLNNTGAIVHHEVRSVDTDFHAFSENISGRIDSLIHQGINPQDIIIVGASKGAVMAMNIANMNTNPVHYILLGANNNFIEEQNAWNLHGQILGIYERSDSLAGRNYDYWIQQSTNATRFEQLEINTGLGHGFLYRPIEAWWLPVKKLIVEK